VLAKTSCSEPVELTSVLIETYTVAEPILNSRSSDDLMLVGGTLATSVTRLPGGLVDDALDGSRGATFVAKCEGLRDRTAETGAMECSDTAMVFR
jgi:hypothetical protein